jgi:molybdopterin converting factor small subunit
MLLSLPVLNAEGLRTMKVQVKLYSILRDYLPKNSSGNSHVMEFPEGITLSDVVKELKVPRDDIKIMFINGIHAKGAERLKEGDRVGIFPPVAGG